MQKILRLGQIFFSCSEPRSGSDEITVARASGASRALPAFWVACPIFLPLAIDSTDIPRKSGGFFKTVNIVNR
jgi:hypothetical protein